MNTVVVHTPTQSQIYTLILCNKLFLWDFQWSVLHLLDQIVRWTSVDGAADALCGSKDLLDGAAQFAGHRAGTHRPGNGEHIVEGDVTVVLDWKKDGMERTS